MSDMRQHGFMSLPGGAMASQLAAGTQWLLRKVLTKPLIAAVMMLPMPNAYAETQPESDMITGAASIALYKAHCRGKIPRSAVEAVNTTIRKYGESRVVASMAEMGRQREKLGYAAFCVQVEKRYLKK